MTPFVDLIVVDPLEFQDAAQPATSPTAAPGDATQTGTLATDGTQPAPQRPGAWLDFLPLVAVIVIFYFLMILPERKNRKKREALLAAVKKGDRVMTTGGMLAQVAAINGDEVTLQIDEGVRARFTRQAIQSVIAEGDEAKK